MKSLSRFFLLFNLIYLSFSISKNDIPDYDKYYKPQEFSNMDMFKSSSKWSWERYKQSEHYFVFWESGFGSDPNSNGVPSNLRVDIDDLLLKAEQFFDTNINKVQMATLGINKSYLDKYKLEIYLLYSTDFVATGSGYDNVIGALWVTPSTCQPVGFVIAHEIGHSFQYQVYCDQIYQGVTSEWEFKSGFRYGYEGSNGGNGFWEQTAQWQSSLDNKFMFDFYHFEAEWLPQQHRHFEHEYMRYGSYWFHYYIQSKYGTEAIGNIWKNSVYPDDAIQTYTKLYNNNDYSITREELFDYAFKIATYDIDVIREYSKNYQGKYTTKFYNDNEGYYQIAYAKCPGATGFNVISLVVPNGNNKEISVEFVGLKPGSSLANDDPGNYFNNIDEGYAGTVNHYNTVNKDNVGWRYGFVAHLKDDSRVYSRVFSDSKSTETFVVPDNTQRLYLVVQGSPESYIHSAWDDKETTDAQFPYKVKFTNTDLLSN